MKEFGSDFHLVEDCGGGRSFLDLCPKAELYANGRQALEVVLRSGGYKRVWMPDYFCYEVAGHVEGLGVDVVFYPDCPLRTDDDEVVGNLEFREGDILLRVNYFGWRGWRDSARIPVPVIEDHSHDLLGEWAMDSNADWCVASLRKTLPLPEGGVLWSPRGHALRRFDSTEENEACVRDRLEGMRLKRDYLRGVKVGKDRFLSLFADTEERLGNLALSGLSHESLRILRGLNAVEWYGRKKRNWEWFVNHGDVPEVTFGAWSEGTGTPFSLVLELESQEMRDKVRERLIRERVYPAVLWRLPDTASVEARLFSGRMLSIHCDGRYTLDDMRELSLILNKAIRQE